MNEYFKIEEISPIPRNHIWNAKIAAYDLSVLKNSITEGEGNLAGFIGEYLVRDRVGAQFVKKGLEMYDYDMIRNNHKLEVKSKRVNTPPLPHYRCAISEFSLHQKCDAYVFTRIMNDLSKAWILGWIPQEEFKQLAKRHEKGDREGHNFEYKCVTYDVEIAQLYNMDSILKWH